MMSIKIGWLLEFLMEYWTILMKHNLFLEDCYIISSLFLIVITRKLVVKCLPLWYYILKYKMKKGDKDRIE